MIHETLDTTTIVNGDTVKVQKVIYDVNDREVGLESPIAASIFFQHSDIMTVSPQYPLEEGDYRVTLRIEDAVGNAMDSMPTSFQQRVFWMQIMLPLLNVDQSVSGTPIRLQ